MAHVGDRAIGPVRFSPRRVSGTALLAWAGWCWLFWSGSASGQLGFQAPQARTTSKVYFDVSHKADADLKSGDNHARSGNYAEAIDIYQRVIQQFGDKVVEVPVEAAGADEDSRLSVNARRECQRRIAALPPEARAIYRGRVDPKAERWFLQGRESRDRTLLRRVVDQAFCSSWGDDALDLLGDLAFQDGLFVEAMAAYVQLVPDRPGGPALIHPDPSVDLARVAAKKLLCRAAIGDHPPGETDLDAFAAAYPAAAGPFAGRKGALAVDLVAAIRDDHLAPPPQSDGRWPTFAGSPTRTRIAPGPVDVGSLQWKVELEPILLTRMSRNFGRNSGMGLGPSPPPPPERLLGYHPIIVGDQVIVANERQVIAYNLNTRPGDQPGATGTAVEIAWKTREDLIGGPMTARGNAVLARYTLTAFGDHVYARLGPPPSMSQPMTRMNFGSTFTSPSYIVALDRSAQGKLLWSREAVQIPLPKRQAGPGIGSRNAVFEGTPVADAHNVYVAITDRIEMTATYVVCLDANTGATQWVRYVCEANATADPLATGGPEISHRLLTLDGPSLYYQTNLGAVASLEAEGGAIRWLATYPWQRRNGLNPGHDRDLNPAIVHDGLVIVAPDDAASIYAFDAATGRLAWKSEPLSEQAKLTHLLGVAKGHLIASGDQVLWFDVKSGKLAHAWPDNAHAVQGFGRGVLAGDRVYWPTRTEIHVLDQASGLVADPPIKLMETFQCEAGNLAVGDGYLVVAQGTALVVFCQNSRLIDRYRDEIARAPDQAINYYRLAQAAEAIGREEVALTSLEAAAPRVRPIEMIDGSPLIDAVRDHQRTLLMKLGRKAKAAKDFALAARRFGSAAEAARDDRDRFAARLELAEVQLARGQDRESVVTLQALLADERMRSLTVDAADGHRSVRADLLVADRLAGTLRDRGRELYADFDRAAADLLVRGKAGKDARLLEDVARSYPSAVVVPEAWRALGELSEESGRPGDAARAYKRLLARAPDDPTKARAILGLARAYEAQKLWVLARDAYLQARKRFGDETVDGPDAPSAVAQLVTDRLAREPFDRMAGDPLGEPGVPVPLRRRWEKDLGVTSRPLGADGTPPSAESGRVFLASGHEIRPVDPATGESAWVADLGDDPVWVGYLADRIIAATKSRLLGLSLDKGAVEWKYDLGTDAKAVNDPFAREPIAEPGRDVSPATLKDFRIVGNRVYCLRGDRSLMAFDGDSGQLDWSYAPTSGRINPHLLVGPRRIVLQVLKPNAIQVLDTLAGTRRAEFPQAEEDEWPRDPLAIDDEHVALVADRFTVALLDTTRGVNAWVFRENKELPSYGPPRLFGDSERLLVLHHGQNLMRLDIATGNKLWRDWRLLGTEDLSERPEAIALGDDRVFVASGSTRSRAGGATLTAYRLSDGSPLWKSPLNGPANAWDLALTERSVAAYPAPARLRENAIGVLPLILHRRTDGEPIQRVLIQAKVSDLAVRFTPKGALVATQAGLWSLGDRDRGR